MKPIRVSEPVARAAARDEADRQMRAAGRQVWSEDDWNTAVRVYNRLMFGRETCAADRRQQS